jgi:type II secretion system (T2SS) protein C
MPRKLAVINAILILIAAGSVVFIARQLMAPLAMPLPARSRTAAPAATSEETPRHQPGAYTTVAARNLFSPTRTESPPSATASASSPAVKPNLFGVVLREGAPIAYLEDPSTKRVAGYRLGDAVAGGTVQTISADSVVINRPDGNMDVRLRDPGKPRSAPVAAGMPGTPGAQPVAGAPVLPGVIPPVGPPGMVVPGPMMTQPPGVVSPPGQAVNPASPPIIPGRRPLPPNLLRRLPQGSPADAPQR